MHGVPKITFFSLRIANNVQKNSISFSFRNTSPTPITITVMGTLNLESILDQELLLFKRMEKSLHDLLDATRKKDAERVGRITEDLNSSHDAAAKLDQALLDEVNVYATAHGLAASEVRLSRIPEGGELVRKADNLRERVKTVAKLSNEAAGVLTANIGVIEDTIKVLESLDARSVGYGSDKGPRRPPKMIDRSA